MPYDFNLTGQQLQDLQRQYQQLAGLAQQPQPTIPTMTVQPPTPSRQVQYVEGIGGARLYQQNLPSNSSEIIMDKDENLFYFVSKDANGTPAKKIPIGRFTIEESVEEPVFLTRKDFDDFKEEIREMFASQNKNSSSNSAKNMKEKTS